MRGAPWCAALGQAGRESGREGERERESHREGESERGKEGERERESERERGHGILLARLGHRWFTVLFQVNIYLLMSGLQRGFLNDLEVNDIIQPPVVYRPLSSQAGAT